jgi:hypothetical protein
MVVVLAFLALGLLPPLQPPAVVSSRASGRIVAMEVLHEDVASRGPVVPLSTRASSARSVGAAGSDTVSVTSEAIDARQWFNYVGVHWRARPGAERSLFVELRTSVDAVSWTDWALLSEEEDMADPDVNELYAAPFAVDRARFAQYRVWATDGDLAAMRRVALTFMDVSDLNESPLVRLLYDVTGALRDMAAAGTAHAAYATPQVQTRADWRADESLMDWMPQYVPWQKAIVHHTATRNNSTDPTADIRAMYYYHAVTRGWGDIGYNYLVDRSGNIWTGRQGGDDVTGGHTFGWNRGSFGVAALGDFSNVALPTPMLEGMARVIAMEFAQRGLQPTASDPFTHKEEDTQEKQHEITSQPPNVIGHRDCSYKIGIYGAQTACPGQGLYNQMATIRNLSQTYVDAKFQNLVAITTAAPRVANTGEAVSVPVTVKNVGTSTLTAANTRLSYQLLDAATGRVHVTLGPQIALLSDLLPGTAQLLNATLNVPGTVGRYLVRWDLQSSGQWFRSLYGGAAHEEWLSAVEWHVTWVADRTPATMAIGDTVPVALTIKNTGSRPWPASAVKLSYHWASDVTQRTVNFNGNRAALPFDVQPGQQVTITLNVTAPTVPTRYRLWYDMVWEGSFWFGDRGVELLDRVVHVPFDYRASYGVTTPSVAVAPGQFLTVPVTVTNTGGLTWPGGGMAAVMLGTHWYTGAGSLFYWDGARSALPHDVGPGQPVTVPAKLSAPRPLGTYRLDLDMVLEGVSWFSEKDAAPGQMTVAVKQPTFGASYAPSPIGAVSASVRTAVPMTVTNTSNLTWSSPVFALGYHVWDSAGRLVQWDGTRTLLPSIVQPGQSVNVQAILDLPSAPGTYTVRWDMLQEGVAWFSTKGVATKSQTVTIGTSTFGATYGTAALPASVGSRLAFDVPVTVTNTSTFSFSPSSRVNLSYHWYGSGGAVAVWDGERTPLTLAPGQSATVTARVTAPAVTGNYTLAFDLVQEGVAWFSSRGVPAGSRAVSVVMPELGALYAAPASASGGAGQTITVPVRLTNVGTRTWDPSRVFLAYRVYGGGALVVAEGARSPLAAPLMPGATAGVQARVVVPTTPGLYDVHFDLVEEGVTWFSNRGVITAPTTLTAQ